MWKTTESIDSRLMGHCITRPILNAELLDQIERKRLVLSILAMLEGKVKKIPFLFFHGDVEALRNGGSGKLACDGIG